MKKSLLGPIEATTIKLKAGQRKQFQDIIYPLGLSMNHCIRRLIQSVIDGDIEFKKEILEGGFDE